MTGATGSGHAPIAFFAALDPGEFGAMVVLRADGSMFRFMRMPLHPLRLGTALNHPTTARTGNGGNIPNSAMLAALLPALNQGAVTFAVEEVRAFGGQGITSSFNFGRNFGVLLGFAEMAAHGRPPRTIKPEEWQAIMLATPLSLSEGTKDRANRAAIRLWPELGGPLRIKRNQGIADAALLAEYSRKTHTQ